MKSKSVVCAGIKDDQSCQHVSHLCDLPLDLYVFKGYAAEIKYSLCTFVFCMHFLLPVFKVLGFLFISLKWKGKKQALDAWNIHLKVEFTVSLVFMCSFCKIFVYGISWKAPTSFICWWKVAVDLIKYNCEVMAIPIKHHRVFFHQNRWSCTYNMFRHFTVTYRAFSRFRLCFQSKDCVVYIWGLIKTLQQHWTDQQCLPHL